MCLHDQDSVYTHPELLVVSKSLGYDIRSVISQQTIAKVQYFQLLEVR